MNTLLIEVTNQEAIGFLQKLEEQHLIKVLKGNVALMKVKKTKINLSEQFRNVFTKEDAKRFMEHTKQMRSEWENT
jgi:cell division septal protein FtsQ